MSLLQLELWQLVILFLPAIFIFWALWDLSTRVFESSFVERYYWMLLVTFVPILGALIYCVFGIKRGKKIIK